MGTQGRPGYSSRQYVDFIIEQVCKDYSHLQQILLLSVVESARSPL